MGIQVITGHIEATAFSDPVNRREEGACLSVRSRCEAYPTFELNESQLAKAQGIRPHEVPPL